MYASPPDRPDAESVLGRQLDPVSSIDGAALVLQSSFDVVANGLKVGGDELTVQGERGVLAALAGLNE